MDELKTKKYIEIIPHEVEHNYMILHLFSYGERDRCVVHRCTGATDAARLVTTCPHSPLFPSLRRRRRDDDDELVHNEQHYYYSLPPSYTPREHIRRCLLSI